MRIQPRIGGRNAALERPDGAAAEAFRFVSASLSLHATTKGARSFAVVSGSPSDGKTTVAANLAITAAAINYLGVKNLRDCPGNASDLGANGAWQKVADATGAKFDAYMTEGSPASDMQNLRFATLLADDLIIRLARADADPRRQALVRLRAASTRPEDTPAAAARHLAAAAAIADQLRDSELASRIEAVGARNALGAGELDIPKTSLLLLVGAREKSRALVRLISSIRPGPF